MTARCLSLLISSDVLALHAYLNQLHLNSIRRRVLIPFSIVQNKKHAQYTLA